MSDTNDRAKALQELNLKIVAARKRGAHDEVQRLKSELEPLLSNADGPAPSPGLVRSRRAALRRQGKLHREDAGSPTEAEETGSTRGLESVVGRFEAVVGRFEAVMTRFEAIATALESGLRQTTKPDTSVQTVSTLRDVPNDIDERDVPSSEAPSTSEVKSQSAVDPAVKAPSVPAGPTDPLEIMRKMSAVNEEIVAARKAGNDGLVRRLELQIEELQRAGIKAAGGLWDPRSG